MKKAISCEPIALRQLMNIIIGLQLSAEALLFSFN
jgi:hypothetical protein